MSNPVPEAKVIVITGATGALGIKTAHAFAGRGHSLALLDRNQDRLDGLTRDLNLPDERLLTSTTDLRDAGAIRFMAEAVSVKFGGAHGLIHLVGGWVGGKTLMESPAEDLEAMFSQHVWTTFDLFQAFGPQFLRNRWGRVIVVSKSTVPDPPGKEGIYAAAKAAQENLVLNLGSELQKNGVTANIIQVRAIDLHNKGTATTPAEIVAAMLYLFSDEAAKINKTRIPLYE